MFKIKTYFGRNLKRIRKSKKISQEVLAEKLGIDRRQLTRIETGKSFPSFSTLENICEALNVPPPDLFDFKNFYDANNIRSNDLIINDIKLKIKQYENSLPKLKFIQLAIVCLEDKQSVEKLQNTLNGMLL